MPQSDARGAFIEIRLWVKHADQEIEPGKNYLAPGWFCAVKHWDGSVNQLTNEPMSIKEIVRIAKAITGTTEAELMPFIETMTAQVLESIESAAAAQQQAIEKAQEALSELAKITKYVEGDEPVKHAHVIDFGAEIQRRAKLERERLENELAYATETEMEEA